ncbi:MAG: TIGR02996 domain-containing protein [Rubripirellula sp.]
MWDHPLFHAVLESPDDDASRLVLADWLEEQGSSLAEFIRVQVAIAASKRAKEDPNPDTLRREVQLYLQHKNAWQSSIHRRMMQTTSLSVEEAASLMSGMLFHRGLPSWMGIAVDRLIEHGDALLAVAPWDSLRLDHEALPTFEELAQWPGLKQFRVLVTQSYGSDVEQLILSPHLREVERLTIACPRNEQQRLAGVCRRAEFTRLSSCRVGTYRVV